MEIVAPEFKKESFNCPDCNAFAHMKWTLIRSVDYFYKLHSATCSCCKEESLWISRLGRTANNVLYNKMISPHQSFSVLPHQDMPEDIKIDFNEAREVFNNSPRAAAALLRLSLQKLCKHLGEPGENINTDIQSLIAKGKLNAAITRAADTVRIVGNNSVHPGEMNSEDVDYIAAKMFELINFIVKKTITEPKELEDLYLMTPENPRNAAEARNQRVAQPQFYDQN